MGVQNGVVDFAAHPEVVGDKNNLLGHGDVDSIECRISMSSQILITGATGFIGRQLTRDLVARGDRVRVLARNRAQGAGAFRRRRGDRRGRRRRRRLAGRGLPGHRDGLSHRGHLPLRPAPSARALARRMSRARKICSQRGGRRASSRVVHLSSGGVLRKRGATDERRADRRERFSRTSRRASAPTRPRSGTRSSGRWPGRGAACRSSSPARRARSAAATKRPRRPAGSSAIFSSAAFPSIAGPGSISSASAT